MILNTTRKREIRILEKAAEVERSLLRSIFNVLELPSKKTNSTSTEVTLKMPSTIEW